MQAPQGRDWITPLRELSAAALHSSRLGSRGYPTRLLSLDGPTWCHCRPAVRPRGRWCTWSSCQSSCSRTNPATRVRRWCTSTYSIPGTGRGPSPVATHVCCAITCPVRMLPPSPDAQGHCGCRGGAWGHGCGVDANRRQARPCRSAAVQTPQRAHKNLGAHGLHVCDVGCVQGPPASHPFRAQGAVCLFGVAWRLHVM